MRVLGDLENRQERQGGTVGNQILRQRDILTSSPHFVLSVCPFCSAIPQCSQGSHARCYSHTQTRIPFRGIFLSLASSLISQLLFFPTPTIQQQIKNPQPASQIRPTKSDILPAHQCSDEKTKRNRTETQCSTARY